MRTVWSLIKYRVRNNGHTISKPATIAKIYDKTEEEARREFEQRTDYKELVERYKKDNRDRVEIVWGIEYF